MFCSKCGTENIEDAVFCSKCGNNLKSTIQADPNQTSMNPKQSKYQQKYDFIFNSS